MQHRDRNSISELLNFVPTLVSHDHENHDGVDGQKTSINTISSLLNNDSSTLATTSTTKQDSLH